MLWCANSYLAVYIKYPHITLTFEFKGKTKAIVIKEGQRQDLSIESDKLQIVLGAGEGVFVIAE